MAYPRRGRLASIAWTRPGIHRSTTAKPVIDLQVSVDALEPRARYVEPLDRLGYLFAPDPESPDLHFFGLPAERPSTRP